MISPCAPWPAPPFRHGLILVPLSPSPLNHDHSLNNLDTWYLQIQTFLLFSKASSVFKSPSRTITLSLSRVLDAFKHGSNAVLYLEIFGPRSQENTGSSYSWCLRLWHLIINCKISKEIPKNVNVTNTLRINENVVCGRAMQVDSK
jgi:hypothetical protein